MTNRQIAILSLIVGIIGAAAAVAVVPDFRCWVLHEDCSSGPPPPIPPGNECDRFASSTFDIAGTWHGQENNVTMTVIRTGCKITSSFGVAPAPHHELSGEYKDGRFDYVVYRTDKGCSVVFDGYLSVVNKQEMTSNVYRTSGACGFAEGWTETVHWTRVG